MPAATTPAAHIAALRDSFSAEIAPIAIFLGLALVPAAAAFGAHAYILDMVMRVMIFAIAALGLDLIVGYGALV